MKDNFSSHVDDVLEMKQADASAKGAHRRNNPSYFSMVVEKHVHHYRNVKTDQTHQKRLEAP